MPFQLFGAKETLQKDSSLMPMSRSRIRLNKLERH
jgi:hypothetical protein